jgi:hypothetical protein
MQQIGRLMAPGDWWWLQLTAAADDAERSSLTSPLRFRASQLSLQRLFRIPSDFSGDKHLSAPGILPGAAAARGIITNDADFT